MSACYLRDGSRGLFFRTRDTCVQTVTIHNHNWENYTWEIVRRRVVASRSSPAAGNFMERHKSDGLIDGKMADKHVDEAANGFDDPTEGHDELVTTAAAVAVVGVGVIIFEAALLPGLVLGIATMVVPKYLPQIGGAINPLVRSTVRGAYKMGQKTREMVAEAQEQMHDIVAEVDAEGDRKAAPPKSPAHSSIPTA